MLSRELLREIRKIEIKTRHLVDSAYMGNYRSVFKGRGIEFAGIREYYRGDEFRSIDWKVTARTGNLHVREHIEERELQMVIALDMSGSMSFGSHSREKRETAVEFAAAMAMSASLNNDRFGACLFTDTVEKYVAPAKGRTHFLRLVRELLYRVPQGRGSDIRPALHLFNQSLKHRSIFFLVTDGIDLPPVERELAVTAARHDLILVLVRDRREREIPDVGLVEIEDPETGEEGILDTSNVRQVARLLEAAEAQERRLLDMCRRIGIDHIDITAGGSVIKPIVRFFSSRSTSTGRTRIPSIA